MNYARKDNINIVPDNLLTPCCEIFAKSLNRGTDNEGYGRLIRLDDDGKYVMGHELPEINYCPWCGAAK